MDSREQCVITEPFSVLSHCQVCCLTLMMMIYYLMLLLWKKKEKTSSSHEDKKIELFVKSCKTSTKTQVCLSSAEDS